MTAFAQTVLVRSSFMILTFSHISESQYTVYVGWCQHAHGKAFLACECSCSKPCWAPSYSYFTVSLLRNIPLLADASLDLLPEST